MLLSEKLPTIYVSFQIADDKTPKKLAEAQDHGKIDDHFTPRKVNSPDPNNVKYNEQLIRIPDGYVYEELAFYLIDGIKSSE